jgi:amino acid transporter
MSMLRLRYLLSGSLVVVMAYLWATLGTMLNLPAAKSVGATTDILAAVQHGFWNSHTFAIVVGLVLIWFFVANTIVYNYSFSRLLFVSGLEQRMPRALRQVTKRTKVPVNAIILQTVLSSLFVCAVFNPWVPSDNTQKTYYLFQAGVTVVWCLSMVLLFADIFLVGAPSRRSSRRFALPIPGCCTRAASSACSPRPSAPPRSSGAPGPGSSRLTIGGCGWASSAACPSWPLC